MGSILPQQVWFGEKQKETESIVEDHLESL